MDWQQEHQHKLTTAGEAVKAVKSGDKVAIPVYSNPLTIVSALANRLDELTDVTILLGAAATDLPWYHPEAEKAFRIEPWYTSPYLPQPIRQMVDERRSDHQLHPLWP